jgi:RNA-directed DNA polymerase
MMSTKEQQIAERARKFKDEALTNLQQYIDVELLEESYQKLNKKSSPGVDGETWQSYGESAQERIPELLSLFKSGKYRAPPVRRVHVPKGKDGKRPIGIPTLEDKILQESVRRVLTPIYEELFKDFSYGFRSGRSPHHAVEYMFREVSFDRMRYIIDADIKSYFDSIDHGILREFLDRRVKDGVIRRMIDKWLKAGVLEGGEVTRPGKGTPQGGTLSPLLSNIYLHYVLDEWFTEQVRPVMKGKCFIVRYADDFVLGFEYLSDAERVMRVLPKRFGRYNLELHPYKTKIVDLQGNNDDGTRGGRSFDFLGFTHFLGKSRKGKVILKRKTSKKKLSAAVQRFNIWIKENRHRRLGELIPEVNAKLRGHYSYYGVTFNIKGITSHYEQVKRSLFKWLNRRGGKPVWNRDKYSNLINEWLPLCEPKIYHTYQSAKPV